jgi:hypothetical protein
VVKLVMAADTENGGQRCFKSGGQIYYGEVKEEQGVILRHGQGHQIVTAVTIAGVPFPREVYRGAWLNGRMTGTGVYKWSDGCTYEGSFLDGKMNGYGKLTWPEGSSYNGTWKDGALTGQGTFYSAFTRITHMGVFQRNCLKQHDGTWLDVVREREQHREASLHIGAKGPTTENEVVIIRCAPNELGEQLETVRRDHFLIPLVIADMSCTKESGASSSAPPLCYLEALEQGCTPATTAHLAYVAAEKRRKRDYARIFREAITESLLSYRYFAIVFGDALDDSPGSSAEAMPASWSLPEFLDSSSLPLNLFDLRHFHGSGAGDAFLPHDKVDTITRSPGHQELPSPTEPSAVEENRDGSKMPASSRVSSKDGQILPPTAYLLQFALVSLRRLEVDLDDEAIRKHLGRRFAPHVPLHRIAVIHVSSSPAVAS